MKRILEITPNFSFAQTFIGGRFTFMQQSGYEMHLICSPHAEFDAFVKKQGIKAKAVNITRLPNLAKDTVAIRTIVRYIRENSIDCVVGHADKGKLLAAIVSRLTGRKLIIWAHGAPLCFRKKGFEKWIFTRILKFDSRHALRVICVSPFVVETRNLHELDGDGQQAIPGKGSCTGLDCLGQFNPDNLMPNTRYEQRSKFGIKDTDFVIGFCGRFTHDKGIDELIPAFQELENHVGDGVKLVMVGKKDIRDAINKETERMIDENPNIICTGYVNHSEIQNVYSIFDLFVLPTYREGLPYVLLENQSMGVPILTTSITGSRDAIVEGQTGEYVDIDINDIVTKISKLYYDSEYRMRLGKQARHWICENFENHIVWSAIKQIYDSALNDEEK